MPTYMSLKKGVPPQLVFFMRIIDLSSELVNNSYQGHFEKQQRGVAGLGVEQDQRYRKNSLKIEGKVYRRAMDG